MCVSPLRAASLSLQPCFSSTWASLVSEARCFGGSSLQLGPKGLGAYREAQTPLSSGRSATSERSLPASFCRRSPCQGWGFGKVASWPLHPSQSGLFFSCFGGFLSVLRFFSERIVAYGAVDMLCLWDEVSSGSSYTVILSNTSSKAWILLLILLHGSSPPKLAK